MRKVGQLEVKKIKSRLVATTKSKNTKTRDAMLFCLLIKQMYKSKRKQNINQKWYKRQGAIALLHILDGRWKHI